MIGLILLCVQGRFRPCSVKTAPGKSTLVKMLYGLLQPDAGCILWEGRRTVIAGLAEVNFAVAAGEILGIAGVAGNGQGELVAALSGERLAARADQIWIAGQHAGRLGPNGDARWG